ncbi:putative ribonuclease H-like domain-containing protein [Tanacetum coccineum]
MAYSSTSLSSSTNSKVSNDLNCCSSCLECVKDLKEQNEQLVKDLRTARISVVSYKTGLESVEARLLVFKKNEFVYEEDIKLLKREIYLRDLDITELKRKLELVTKEKDKIMDKCKIGLGYNVVPPPYTGNFMPLKPNLVYPSLDDFVDVNESASESIVEKPIVETNEPKTARKEDGSPIIEDWVSESEEEDVPKIKSVKMFNKPSFAKINFVKSTKQVKSLRKTSIYFSPSRSPRGNYRETLTNRCLKNLGSNFEMFNKACHVNVVGNPQQDLKNKRVIDSGCSRHMTGNRSYLTDYEEIDGGFVAFEGNSKGGKITRKGKIKTGKLDFEDVYFVKELKFNLFSVSQMCDKKNSVLFTDTECVVLSPDFKLTDESHVLLKVPRKDNMYSVDLKNVVPQGGLTCLFAKATPDESNLWHRRLGHKEKQHRASCKTKTISSISQPLQMLHMDLFGPTFVKSLMKKMYCLVVTDDFSRFSWVFFLATKNETSEILKTFITCIENLIDLKVKVIRCDNGTEFKNRVMNQFCEMKGIKREFSIARTPQQNRVVERKNRTLIEAARTMLAELKLPTTFWAEAVNTACYVQNRVLVIKPYYKTPYELFLGYSTNSKAFRVFNSRTRIVEENLHVQFSKNTPNIAGSGPNWLFDIDALTNSMNYKLVVAGNQSNGNADPPFSSSPKNSPDAGFKPSREEEKKDAKNQGNEGGKPSTEEPRINQENDASVNSTNNINTVSPTVNADSIEDNGLTVNAASNIRLQVKQKEDGIFISQDKYVTEILKKFGFSDVKTANTPMETHKPLLTDIDGEDVDEHMYRSMIGSLMYLTSLRPNIMFDCKKQTVVANSTTKAKYVAASSCCGQTKHIEIRHYFIRDSNEKKLIQMIKIHTDKNVIYLLTKAFDIDDVDIEEMDINWQITMIAIRMKKFYKKTRRRARIDGNKPIGFDKKKLECFKCYNTGHFARECPSKGINVGKKRDSFYQDQGARKKEQNQNCLLTMGDGVVN